MSASQKDDIRRVVFEHPLKAKLMAIDGTWLRDSFLIEVSDIGAEIELADRAADFTEFFLLLTDFGNPVYRHCKREWVNGTRVGVKFIRRGLGNKPLQLAPMELESGRSAGGDVSALSK
jgi:hypothetical protein